MGRMAVPTLRLEGLNERLWAHSCHLQWPQEAVPCIREKPRLREGKQLPKATQQVRAEPGLKPRCVRCQSVSPRQLAQLNLGRPPLLPRGTFPLPHSSPLASLARPGLLPSSRSPRASPAPNLRKALHILGGLGGLPWLPPTTLMAGAQPPGTPPNSLGAALTPSASLPLLRLPPGL